MAQGVYIYIHSRVVTMLAMILRPVCTVLLLKLCRHDYSYYIYTYYKYVLLSPRPTDRAERGRLTTSMSSGAQFIHHQNVNYYSKAKRLVNAARVLHSLDSLGGAVRATQAPCGAPLGRVASLIRAHDSSLRADSSGPHCHWGSRSGQLRPEPGAAAPDDDEPARPGRGRDPRIGCLALSPPSGEPVAASAWQQRRLGRAGARGLATD